MVPVRRQWTTQVLTQDTMVTVVAGAAVWPPQLSMFTLHVAARVDCWSLFVVCVMHCAPK